MGPVTEPVHLLLHFVIFRWQVIEQFLEIFVAEVQHRLDNRSQTLVGAQNIFFENLAKLSAPAAERDTNSHTVNVVKTGFNNLVIKVFDNAILESTLFQICKDWF